MSGKQLLERNHNLKAFRIRIVDAFHKAMKATIFALWVPPAVLFAMTLITAATNSHGRFLLWEYFLRTIYAGLSIASIGFIVGSFGLFLVGLPFLFLLNLLRINHPLIPFGIIGIFTFYRFRLVPIQSYDDAILMFSVADSTAVVAILYLWSHLDSQKAE
jgi:hypothetical protein